MTVGRCWREGCERSVGHYGYHGRLSQHYGCEPPSESPATKNDDDRDVLAKVNRGLVEDRDLLRRQLRAGVALHNEQCAMGEDCGFSRESRRVLTATDPAVERMTQDEAVAFLDSPGNEYAPVSRDG